MNRERAIQLIAWKSSTNTAGMDYDKYFGTPLMEAFGDDPKEIIAFLDSLDREDLYEVSGVFEDIYKKFMTEEMWEALEWLEQKYV